MEENCWGYGEFLCEVSYSEQKNREVRSRYRTKLPNSEIFGKQLDEIMKSDEKLVNWTGGRRQKTSQPTIAT